ncbi:hypothetical protein [Alistipes timonensis]|uniref:hypothetical protein n=2 Tax=Bacteroidales TaxID=171549 RepID=UPI002060B142|nr:hypothetical protein [Alistipes timonensis]DAO68743.1 MAG TPA: activating signal cointegrator [Caudoviricetes sp.]
MNILKLTLCRKWFDMILRGEKPYEYRGIKVFWTRRLMRSNDVDSVFCPDYWEKATIAILNNTVKEEHFDIEFREFDAIEFYRGVPYFDPESPRMLIECHGICAGFGRPELGAPEDRRAFILKLGLLIETHNCDNLKIN